MDEKFFDDYNKLDKLELGEKVTLNGYGKLFACFPDLDEKARYAYFKVVNPSFIDYPTTNLWMEEIHGEIKSFAIDGSEYDEDYYNEEIDLDKDKVRGYLDLFEKYKSIINHNTEIELKPNTKRLIKKRT